MRRPKYADLAHETCDPIKRFGRKLAVHAVTPRSVYLEPDILQAVHTGQALWAMDLLLLRLLQNSALTDDPRSEESGRNALNEYCMAHPDADLTWEKLVEGGWLRVVWGRWHIPMGLGSQDGTSRFLDFFRVLREVPYSDSRRTLVRDARSVIHRHAVDYPDTPPLEELAGMGIIEIEQDEVRLDLQSPHFRHCAAQVFARFWTQTVVGPIDPDERLSWWYAFFEQTHDAYAFCDFLSELALSSFIDACWHRIQLEDDIVGWLHELQVLTAARASRQPDPIAAAQSVNINEPEGSMFDQLEWWTRYADCPWVDSPRVPIRILCSWVLEWDGKNEIGQRRRLLRDYLVAIRERPYLMYAMGLGHANTDLIPYLLLYPEGVSFGLALLGDLPVRYGDGVQEDRSERRELWLDGLQFVFCTLRKMPEDQTARRIIEVYTWLEATEQHSWHQERRDLFLEGLSSQTMQDGGMWICRIASLICDGINELIGQTHHPLVVPAVGLLRWLVVTIDEVAESAYVSLANAYLASMRNGQEWSRDPLDEATGWVEVANYLAVHQVDLWKHVLQPLDFGQVVRDALEVEDEETRLRTLSSVSGKIRSHIRLLSMIIGQGSDSFPSDRWPELLDVFEHMLLEYSTDDPVNGNLDVSTGAIEAVPLNPKRPLVEMIAYAIDAFPNERRNELLCRYVDVVHDARRISGLAALLSRSLDRHILVTALDSLPIDDFSVTWLTEVQQTVEGLLKVGAPALALGWLDHYDEKGLARLGPDWGQWSFRSHLQAQFMLHDYDSIRRATVPTTLATVDEARQSLRFYRALVEIEDPYGDPEAGVQAFRTLSNENPHQAAYSVNLFAAMVRAAVRVDGDDGRPATAETARMYEILEMGRRLRDSCQHDQFEKTQTVWLSNELFLLFRLKDWSQFWASYYASPEVVQLSIEVGTIAVQAMKESRDLSAARQLLGRLQERHGMHPQLEDLDRKLAPPQPAINVSRCESIRSALLELPTLVTEEQVRAWGDGQADTEQFLIREVFLVCQGIQQFAPNLVEPPGDVAEEDRLTELLRFILGQRVERLGWNVSTQQPGGFTATNSRTGRGGIGERDLLVKRGENRVLTIAEALTLRGADANHILRHLDKLLGYIPGGFRLGFLISWGYSRDIDTTWGTYRDIIADRGRSTHLKFPITRMGEVAELVMAEYLQGLRAFYAEHQGGVGMDKTRVIHVCVDMINERERQAAAAART